MNKMMITRTAVLVLLLLNQTLVMFGLNPLPFSEEQLFEGITVVLTVAVTYWNWYKNNSFTKEAKEADEYLRELKKN